MRVKIFTSETFSEASKNLIEELRLTIDELDTQHLVFIPKEFSLILETLILRQINKKATINVEVMSLDRFANVALEDIKNLKTLSESTAVVLMEMVIKECQNDFTYIKNASKKAKFAYEMYKTITYLRENGASKSALDATIQNIKNKSLKNKLEDIYKVYACYLDKLQNNYQDYSKIQEDFLMALERDEVDVSSYNFFMTDINELSQIEERIVTLLIKKAKSFNFAAISKSDGANKRVYQNTFLLKIKELANEAGCIAEEIYRPTQITGKRREILDYLFSYSNYKSKAKDDFDLMLFRAINIEKEVEKVAKEIRESVVCKNLRYKDISVACADLDKYRGYIEKVFQRYEIPYFLDKKVLISQQAMYKHIIAALNTREKNYRSEEVLEYIKSHFFDIEFEKKCQFENYLEKYSIEFIPRNKKLKALSSSDEEDIDAVNEVREKLINELSIIHDKTSASEIILSIKEYIEKTKLYEKNASLSEESQLNYRNIIKQVEGKIEHILSDIDSIMGNTIVLISDIIRLLKSMGESINISNIPIHIDNVYIGSTLDTQFSECKELYLVGANSENILTGGRPRNLFNEKDEILLSQHNLIKSSRASDINLLERYKMISLIIKPTQKLSVSYAQLVEGEIKSQSVLIAQLAQIFNTNIESYFGSNAIEAKDISSKESLKNILYRNREFKDKSLLYDKLLKLGQIEIDDFHVEDSFFSSDVEMVNNINELLRFDDEGRHIFSASAIEAYNKCPLSYYFNYLLSIQKSKSLKIENKEKGIIVHELLEILLKDQRNTSLTDSELIKKVSDIFDSIINNNDTYKILYQETAQGRSQLKNIKDECILIADKVIRLIKENSKFTPKEFEVAFRKNARYKPLEIDIGDEKVLIEGKIDRIDICQDEFIVVDYKTSAGFSKKDFEAGVAIQLFVYAAAYKSNNKQKEVMGVYYLPLKLDYGENEIDFNYSGVPEVKKNQRRDDKIGEDGKAQIEEYIKYIEEVIKNSANKIIAGQIKPTPSQDACKYCDYKNICKVGVDSYEF